MILRAHSPVDGREHPLRDHLEATAEAAAGFAAPFGAEEWARAAGLLHDLGKASARFQRYLQGIEDAGGDHKAAGAIQARELSLPGPISLAILGHHGGLPALGEAKGRLAPASPPEGAGRVAEVYGSTSLPRDLPAPGWLPPADPREVELLTRMLLAALADADYLDTEGHFSPEVAALRAPRPALDDLCTAFDERYQRRFGHAASTTVNAVRQEVFGWCVAAAQGPQGVYSLTVPTGGGKTLASLAFALHHAVLHRLRRVIVVVPYTSIIEQTADVYREYLPADAVLEHHSSVVGDESEASEQRRLLAAENWDAPVIVTTAVQFFESLFANRPARCRKLHNIARSVVVVDEVQTLPVGLIGPTFELVGSLAEHYGVTCLLTTATQPAYRHFTPLPVREIVPDPPALARRLRRVSYTVAPAPLSWEEAAARMAAGRQAMAVVNTRADARALYAQLPEDARLHLSTNLCGAHRREVLAEVRRRLAQGEPCLLATTQLVEAGVDLDFPLVLRALGPLVSVVQAAGRCNREGRLQRGELLLFTPEEGHLPPGGYRTATDVTSALLAAHPEADLDDPTLHSEYFGQLYQASAVDARGVSALRASLDFPAVATAYRLIEDDSVPVAVAWSDGARDLLDEVEHARLVTRADLRALQPYLVNLRRRELQQAQAGGLCREVVPGSGLWRWEGRYDDLGLQSEFDVLTI